MLNDFIHSEFNSGSKITNRALQIKSKNLSTSSDVNDKPSKSNSDKNSSPSKSPSRSKQSKDLTDEIMEKIEEAIGHYENVPNFLRDNEFIRTGYRIGFSTPKMILKSLFMVHNELVNIWSHLGGAIILIVICVVLCFSVSSIDTQNLQNFVQQEVKELFEPIYNSMPDFSKFEMDISEKITQTGEDIAKFGENAVENFEASLQTLAAEIEQAKSNLSPEAVGRLLTTLKSELDLFSEMTSSVMANLDREKLAEISSNLRKNITEFQEGLVNNIDSSNFDWIDIYKYINPSYCPSINRKKGVQIVPLSRWPIVVFLLSAVFCLLCSTIFHLFYCLNRRAFNILRRLDYAGISILITGSCFPPFVYGFYCEPFYSKLYLSIVGTTSVVVFFVSLGDKIHSEEHVKTKAFMYGGLGVLAGLPVIHLTYLYVTDQGGNLNFVSSLAYYLSMGVSYLGGLAVYSVKCPERFKPGEFDIVGHSHQIWHLCVLLGIILTYFGAFDNYYTRMETPCIGCLLP